MKNTFDGRSTFSILLELIVEAEISRSKNDFFAGDKMLTDMVSELERRVLQDFERSPEVCIRWFSSPAGTINEKQKNKIFRLLDMKSGEKKFDTVFSEIISEMKDMDPET
jgi:hypothetical protein